MARIETYGSDTFITAFDKVIGTDADSNKASKNYEMGEIRDYVVAGIPPGEGGVAKITCIIQDTPNPLWVTPEDLVNDLLPNVVVAKYETVFVSLTFIDIPDNNTQKTKTYAFKLVDVTVGDGQTPVVANDFVHLGGFDIDLSTIVSSIGDAGVDTYKGYNATTKSHEVRKIKSTTLDATIDGDSVKLEIPQSVLDDITYSANEGHTSIGDAGVDVYKGLNITDNEFRKIKSTSLDVTVDGDSVKIETNPVTTNAINSTIGDAGIETYKGYNAISEKHEFRKIKSDTLDVTQDAESVKIEVVTATSQSDWNQADNLQPDYIKNKPNSVNILLKGTIAVGTPGDSPLSTVYPSTGGIITATKITDGVGEEVIRVTFTNLGTADYFPMIASISQGDPIEDNDLTWSVLNFNNTFLDISISEQAITGTEDYLLSLVLLDLSLIP